LPSNPCVKIFRLGLIAFCLVLSAACACASAVFIQVTPDRVPELPVSVQVAGGEFGPRFTVFYRTNSSTLDRLLRANLLVADADHQVASSDVAKAWKSNGVEFTFTIALGYLAGSRFSLFEDAHAGDMPMPGFTEYWFYPRDFATNAAFNLGQTNGNTVAAEIMTKLPARIAQLKPGTLSSQVWSQLDLSAYQGRLGGVSYSFRERHWLTWNYELELIYQEPPAEPPAAESGQPKLVRATLYRNGLGIATSITVGTNSPRPARAEK